MLWVEWSPRVVGVSPDGGRGPEKRGSNNQIPVQDLTVTGFKR